jgi:hypothetical protein
MRDVPPQMRFSEEIIWLIHRNTRFGGMGVVRRLKMEEVGANVGMSAVAAREWFLTFQGSLWEVYTGSLAFSMTESAETNRLASAERGRGSRT